MTDHLDKYVSNCCGKPLKVEGEGQTHWYACTGCGKGADPVLCKPDPTCTFYPKGQCGRPETEPNACSNCKKEVTFK